MTDKIKKDTEKSTTSNIDSERKKDNSDTKKNKELSVEERLKETEDRLLRSKFNTR